MTPPSSPLSRWSMCLLSTSCVFRPGHSLSGYCSSGTRALHFRLRAVFRLQFQGEAFHLPGLAPQSHRTGKPMLNCPVHLLPEKSTWQISYGKKLTNTQTFVQLVLFWIGIDRNPGNGLSIFPGSNWLHRSGHGSYQGWPGASEIRHGCADRGGALYSPHCAHRGPDHRPQWATAAPETKESFLGWGTHMHRRMHKDTHTHTWTFTPILTWHKTIVTCHTFANGISTRPPQLLESRPTV